MAGTLKGMGCACISVGGVFDHVHIAIQFPRTATIANVVSELKTSSTKYLKFQHKVENFAWQSGYGVFSVSESDVPALKTYIRNQKEHHAAVDFQAEFRKLLQDHNLEYDERYVWD